MRDIRVATAQLHHAPGDRVRNLQRVDAMSREAAKRGAEIVAFPEMCIPGYWHLRNLSRDSMDALSESVPDGQSAEHLMSLSRELGITIGAGLLERDAAGKLYNSYLVAMPDGSFTVHRKLHVFVSEFLTPGGGYTVFDTPHGCRVGVLICWDNNLVENARATALMGAEILLAPHQTGGCNSVSPKGMKPIDPSLWERRAQDPEALRAEYRGPKGRGWLMRWLPSRAHDNGIFLLFSNGVGRDDDEVRTGGAMVLDPYGDIIAESDSLEDDLVVADLEAEVLAGSSGRRWMRARRPELYGVLAERTGKEEETRAVRFGLGSR